MAGHFYILASRKHGTLYCGVTSDLEARIWQHREGAVEGFTKRHSVKRLMFFETYDDITDAILREKRVKEWKRDWKIELIESANPDWTDLAVIMLNFEPLPSAPIPFRHPGESRDPRFKHFK